MSVQIFNKKSDFDLYLDIVAKGHRVEKAYDANAHAYFYYYNERGVDHFIGWAGCRFNKFGVTFTDELHTTIAELQKIGQEYYLPETLTKLCKSPNKVVGR